MSIITCPECGAPAPDGGTCRDHFHALLILESQIPGGPGEAAHFYAVATYGLHHPDSMQYTADTLAGLYRSLTELLDGRVTLDDIRRRTRRAANGTTRVTRRKGDAAAPWRKGSWPMTVVDVLHVEVDADAYAERVTRWARSVRKTLDADQVGIDRRSAW